MIGIETEAAVFAQAILSGNLIYMVYTVLRVIRRIFKHSLVWISVEDSIFWIGTAIYLCICIQRTCSGVIRWYFVTGVLLGGLLTHEIVKKIHKKHIAKRKKRE